MTMTTYQKFTLLTSTLVTVFLAMILNVLSVITDIIVLSVWFPPKYDGSLNVPPPDVTTNRFAAVSAIFNMIFRYACNYLHCLIKTRSFICI